MLPPCPPVGETTQEAGDWGAAKDEPTEDAGDAPEPEPA